MKNYQNSDYACNKYAKGIVYKFSDQIVEVTLADYLTENPDKTEQDFRVLKELSDAIYLDQVRMENAQTKKTVSIHGMEGTRSFGSIPLEEQYIEQQDKQYVTEAIVRLLESGVLTATQRRRFILYFFKGLSLRGIAKHEGVFFTSVAESVKSATDKLKEIFADF